MKYLALIAFTFTVSFYAGEALATKNGSCSKDAYKNGNTHRKDKKNKNFVEKVLGIGKSQ